jgi:ABC-2 type transport system permease protein
MWHKYWAVIRQSIQDAITYRTELVLWIVLDTLPTLILFFVWQAVFRNGSQVNGYTFSSMSEFYFYFLMITTLTSAHFEQNKVEKIRQGQIDHYLTRPLSYPTSIFWSYVANKFFYFLFLIPSLIVLALVAHLIFGATFSPITFSKMLQFSFLLAGAFAIEYLLALIIVLLGFWFEHSEGLEHFKWIVITLLGGSLIPKAFMPAWLQTLVGLTPFQYMYNVPIDIIQGRRSLQIWETLPLICFVIILVLITRKLWKGAVYRYTSAGG